MSMVYGFGHLGWVVWLKVVRRLEIFLPRLRIVAACELVVTARHLIRSSIV